jgi:two-component sensor histidine kinase
LIFPAVSPIKDEKGEIVGTSKIARDIAQFTRARERQDLLLREMDHRIKNLFALAISVLRLSGRSAGSVPELIESTSDRLSALARAHTLTLSFGLRELPQAAKPATLHSLIQAIMAPHDAPDDSDASKFLVIGCDMEISGSVISSLALLLNEFATNATKIWRAFDYGRANPNPMYEPRRDPRRHLERAWRTRSRISNG